MRRTCLALPLLATALFGTSDVAHAEPRALLELFTSQGCSSCPPADKLMGELARDHSLVAISLPVDYWDYLGWKDTLARPRHSARQRGYAVERGDRQVYTPQIVVNGLAHVIGSDRDAIENAISRLKGAERALSVSVGMSVDRDQVTVQLTPPDEGSSVAEVWLVGIAKALPVAIKRGENKGRTVTYHNVARHWIKLGVWTGGAQRWTVPMTELPIEDIDAVSVFVQAGGVDRPGAVLGASLVSLR